MAYMSPKTILDFSQNNEPPFTYGLTHWLLIFH
jgi:hypothetical protein